MGYPHGTVPTAPGVEVHPTPIYETLAMGLVAWGLWQLRDRFRPGVLFALYLVFAGVERFLVEFLRRNEVVALGLTGPQLESVLLVRGGRCRPCVAAFCKKSCIEQESPHPSGTVRAVEIAESPATSERRRTGDPMWTGSPVRGGESRSFSA